MNTLLFVGEHYCDNKEKCLLLQTSKQLSTLKIDALKCKQCHKYYETNKFPTLIECCNGWDPFFCKNYSSTVKYISPNNTCDKCIRNDLLKSGWEIHNFPDFICPNCNDWKQN